MLSLEIPLILAAMHVIAADDDDDADTSAAAAAAAAAITACESTKLPLFFGPTGFLGKQ